QRCTTLRRLIVHESIYDTLLSALKRAYESIRIGNPLTDGVLVGPLINEAAFERMQRALETAKADGATIHGGTRVSEGVPANSVYVRPAIVEMPRQTEIVREE